MSTHHASPSSRRRRPAGAAAIGLAAVASLLLSACGGGSSSGEAGAGAAATSAHGPSTTAAATSATTATTAAAAAPKGVHFARVALRVPAGAGAAPFDSTRRLTVPAGWSAAVWARVDAARFEVWTPEHALLVSASAAGRIVRLTPRSDGAAPGAGTTILAGLTQPQGMAFDRVGGRELLYVAESNRVDRYDWSNGRPGNRTTVVDNLPDTDPVGDDVHRAKSLVVAPDHALYVTLASSTNAGLADSQMHPERGTIARIDPSSGRLSIYARGARNGEGLAFDPDGRLWTAVNNRDNIMYPFHRSYGGVQDAFGQTIPAYVNDHPAEELAKLSDGRNLGWPLCNPDPDVHPGEAGSALSYDRPAFTPDAHNNPGATKLDCSKLPRIERGIPAHSAPLGLHFAQGSALPKPWRDGAVLALHGSWNRHPPRAPALAWFPWNAAKHTVGDQVALVSGFQLPSGDRWGRPVDALPGPDGALYVTDDLAGAVYRIGPNG
ncbi:MAG: gluconolaconase [Conexibacter sp.]|nr:gluconolaconase [Conexibacter sp.]